MNTREKLPGVLLAGVLACGGPDTAPPRPAPGTPPQGLKAQGQKLQGQKLQGQKLQGLRLAGAEVEGVDLDGTRLVGRIGGRTLAGLDFVGATLTGFDQTGAQVAVTVQAIEPDAQDSSGETLLYTLAAFDPIVGSWENPCEPDAEKVRKAIPVRGVWDATGARLDAAGQITFGCTSGVIAKCVRWGYRPWQSAAGRPLREHHQACTRLARADYCGDGVSHTEEGTLIDVYDDLQVQKRVRDSGLFFDGAWTPAGAYCVQKQRWLRLRDLPSLRCQLLFVDLDLLEPDPARRASPIDPEDLCAVKRSDLARDAVLMDNRSGINAAIL